MKNVDGKFNVRKEQGRIYVETDGEYDYEETVAALKRVFGIVEKAEDGTLKTVLSAFDAETCAAVDVDILTLV